MSALERMCFLVDWFDVHAQLTRNYQLFFYPADNTIEMYDVKQRRTFLKRTKSEIKLQDLHLGAAVNIFSRQLAIRDYGDEYTRGKLERQMEKALVVIKPHAMDKMGEIIDYFIKSQYIICRMKTVQFSRRSAEELSMMSSGSQPYFGDVVASLEGDRALALEVMKANAFEDLPKIIGECSRVAFRIFGICELKMSTLFAKGPALVQDAKASEPASLRAKFGQQGFKNGVHVSNSTAGAGLELGLIFDDVDEKIARTAVLKNSTLAIIRPHAVRDGLTGKIISSILAGGFQITDMQIFNIDRVNAEDFLEVYKGVVPEYHISQLMLDEMTSGPLVAIEITGKVENIVSTFRDFVGPTDPQLGRQLRPKSLRALYGTDKVKNAVHCTDLEEDGPLEVQFFFRIMASA
ncbi:Nucleoside diphosphate kinase 7 [Blyttiomyces sp. JEL0837]|nr:Nucleoside diphosphate kinase 7 [Blyttiomyces sp. JEL0837]